MILPSNDGYPFKRVNYSKEVSHDKANQDKTLQRICEQWKKTRVERINLLKAICREHGIEYEDGAEKFLKTFCTYITAPDLTALRPFGVCQQSCRLH